MSGDAGAGKTTALRYYAETNTGVIFITANACTTSATAVLSLICQQVGRQVPGRKAALMNTLVEQLVGTNRLIIIDEADHLSLDALQAVRNLNDLAGVGIVLSGNDKIYRQIKPDAGAMSLTNSAPGSLSAKRYTTITKLRKWKLCFQVSVKAVSAIC